MERERMERERMERERIEKERIEKERIEKERIERRNHIEKAKTKIIDLKVRLKHLLEEEDQIQRDLEKKMIIKVRHAQNFENLVRKEILQIEQQNNLPIKTHQKT